MGLAYHGCASKILAMRILPFEPRHAEAWRVLNEAWISEHFVLEAKDREVLSDPHATILSRGGFIFIAEQGGRACGCAGLVPMTDGGFELVKMAVDESTRGAGVGRALLQACIEKARALGAERLYLETNSRLAPALALYRTAGFRDLPPQPSPYARCDTWMALQLS